MLRLDSNLASDYRRHRPGVRPTILGVADLATSHPGFLACSLLRVQLWLLERGRRRTAYKIRALNHTITGADFVPGCSVGEGLLIHHPSGIVVGGGVTIGKGCTLLQQVTLGEKRADGQGPSVYPRVGDDVVIGAGAKVLGDIIIGSGASIGASAVVLASVPAHATVVGNPGRIIKHTQL